MMHRTLPTVLLAIAPLAAQQPQAATNATVEVHGRVHDSRGRPVSGAAVAYAGDDVTVAELLEEPMARTDDGGVFSFRAPGTRGQDPLGTGSLILAAQGYASVRVRVSWRTREEDKELELDLRQRLDFEAEDIVLVEGTAMFGRIREGDGTPVEGAEVLAIDALAGVRQMTRSNSNIWCRAVADKDGIFRLPCVPSAGVSLTASKPGYYRSTLSPISTWTPLEIELEPSGWVRGRVLDPTGRLLAKASVSASYERSIGSRETVQTGEDGSFALPIQQPGRFAVAALPAAVTGPDGKITRRYQRIVDLPRSAPAANIELIAEPLEETESEPSSPLHIVVRRPDGNPAGEVRYAATWNTMAIQNVDYREYRLGRDLARAKPVSSPLELAGPRGSDSKTGILRVVAAGCAPLTLEEVEWEELDPGQPRTPLEVQLEPEAAIAGRLVDEASGEPVAGAQVWATSARPSSYRSNDDTAPSHAAETGADGSFRVGSLGPGKWKLMATHPDRPDAAPKTVELEAEQQVDDCELPIPAGAKVRGTVVGMDLPVGSEVFLHPVDVPVFTGGGISSRYSSSFRPELISALDGDGGFELAGVPHGYYLVMLSLPPSPRSGEPLRFPLDALRVRGASVEERYDAAADRPGTIRGRLRFSGETPPLERLCVVARQLSNNTRHYYGGQIQGTRALVGRDGTFELACVAGRHTLMVVDYALGLQVGTIDEVEVRAGAPVDREFDLDLACVRVGLAAEDAESGRATVGRLEVRFAPAVQDNNNRGVVFGGNSDRDRGIGIDWPVGVPTIDLWLPAGDLTVLARNTAHNLAAGDRRQELYNPLGSTELEVQPGSAKEYEITVEVCPPRELGETQKQ